MNTLPPTRDLPPPRHTEIRAQLQRAVLTETVARRGLGGLSSRAKFATGGDTPRRWLLPVAAAAAAMAMLGTATVLASRDGSATGTRVTPASAGASGLPGTAPAAPSAKPTVPGIMPDEAREIERGCLASAGIGSTAASQPAPTTGPSAEGVRLVNLVTDDAGRLALLYGTDAVLTCIIGGSDQPYNAGFGPLSGSAGERPGPLVVDSMGANSGGDVAGRDAPDRGQRGFELAAGRIADNVVRVTMTVDGLTVDAVLANGTFVARLVHPSTWAVPDRPRPVLIRAFDAAGNELATVDPTAPGIR